MVSIVVGTFSGLKKELWSVERTELGIHDREGLLPLALLNNLIGQELFQALAELALLQRGDVLYSGRGRREPVQALQLQSITRKDLVSVLSSSIAAARRGGWCSQLVRPLGGLKLLPEVTARELG